MAVGLILLLAFGPGADGVTAAPTASSVPALGSPAAASLSSTDLARLQNTRLEPFAASDGSYQLRLVDTATGATIQPGEVTDPRLQEQFSRIAGRHYATLVDAKNSGRSYQGWLTRQARVASPAAAAPSAAADGVGAGGQPAGQPAATNTSASAAIKSLRNQSLQSIPVMLGAGFAVDAIQQAIQKGPTHVDWKSSWKSVANVNVAKAVGGAIAGGAVGGLAGIGLMRFMGPLGLPLMLAGDVAGAMLGANLATGTKTDWKRFAFDTAFQTAVAFPLFFANPVLGFVGMAGAARLADKAYDWLFLRHKKKDSSGANGTPDGPADSKGKPPRAVEPPLEAVHPPPSLLGVESLAVR